MQPETRAARFGPAKSAQHHLTSFAEVDAVLRSRDFVPAGGHRESAPFVANSLIMLSGDPHFERRRMEAALFARAALQEYEHEVFAPSVATSVREAAAAGRGADGIARTNLVSLVRRTLLRISAVMTGIDHVDTPEETDRFGHFVTKLSEGTTVESSTRDHAEVVREVLALREAFVVEFYGPSLARRQALVDAFRAGDQSRANLPRDLTTLMITDPNDSWDDDLPLREVTLYLTAATHTTTNATPHVVKELADWWSAHPEDRERVEDLDFLKRAAHETLRLHLPVAALMRKAACDVTLPSGRAIADGDDVALSIDAANRDPEVFGADADRFDPWRETPRGVKPFGFAFGGGDHMCIGRAFVTGQSRRTGDEDSTLGTIVTLLQHLYEHGMEPDPKIEPVMNPAVVTDSYSSFPIVLTKA